RAGQREHRYVGEPRRGAGMGCVAGTQSRANEERVDPSLEQPEDPLVRGRAGLAPEAVVIETALGEGTQAKQRFVQEFGIAEKLTYCKHSPVRGQRHRVELFWLQANEPRRPAEKVVLDRVRWVVVAERASRFDERRVVADQCIGEQ